MQSDSELLRDTDSVYTFFERNNLVHFMFPAKKNSLKFEHLHSIVILFLTSNIKCIQLF